MVKILGREDVEIIWQSESVIMQGTPPRAARAERARCTEYSRRCTGSSRINHFPGYPDSCPGPEGHSIVCSSTRAASDLGSRFYSTVSRWVNINQMLPSSVCLPVHSSTRPYVRTGWTEYNN